MPHDPSEPASINERIWLAVAAIPEGRVSTYGAVARAAGLPRGARRVGRALGALAHDSGIPWYRVINAQGRIAIPRSSPAAHEQWERLVSEGVIPDANGRIDLRRYGV
jgi:methylated-DNA-protein-cysteine methyltransferase-like protein